MTEETEQNWISGFWRRIGAFLIDSIVLGLIGLSMGFFLEEFFVEIGVWGRLIGFSIALVYFGVMNSDIANGQTLGKKALKLRVVNSDNKKISLVRSVGRYSILGIPFFLNGAQFSDETMFSSWLYILSFVIFGGLLSVVYLYIFNRVTRQSLHDLVCDTYVVNIRAEKQDTEKVWRPHLVVVVLLFSAAAIVPVFTSSLVQQEPFLELVKSRDALMDNPSVKYATVSSGRSTVSTVQTGTNVTTYLSAQVYLKKNDVSDADLARELAQSIFRESLEARKKDVIVIDLNYGYDIGITKKWYRYSYRFEPSEFSSNEQEQSNQAMQFAPAVPDRRTAGR